MQVIGLQFSSYYQLRGSPMNRDTGVLLWVGQKKFLVDSLHVQCIISIKSLSFITKVYVFTETSAHFTK